MIEFNIPYVSPKAGEYQLDTLKRRKLSGDGYYTHACSSFFENHYGINKSLLTTSCTDSLEMAAILLNIKPGDEVIVPSYTFVSTANAFALRGAKLVFADSGSDNPNICPKSIASGISEKTKAIVVVHYAGIACDMDEIFSVANGIPVVEDAAQAIDSYHNDKLLGTLGVLGTYSFHETKNIISGEGGLLLVNDDDYSDRSEIIREKGTNRKQYFKGEVDKYGWVDIGSSFLPSELNAALLFSQLEELESIQARRIEIWEKYQEGFNSLGEQSVVGLPNLPSYATNNAHMFYLLCNSLEERDSLIAFCKSNGVKIVFHYSSLHKSEYFSAKHDGRELPNSDRYTDVLVRLPLYPDLDNSDVEKVIATIKEFYLKSF